MEDMVNLLPATVLVFLRAFPGAVPQGCESFPGRSFDHVETDYAEKIAAPLADRRHAGTFCTIGHVGRSRFKQIQLRLLIQLRIYRPICRRHNSEAVERLYRLLSRPHRCVRAHKYGFGPNHRVP